MNNWQTLQLFGTMIFLSSASQAFGAFPRKLAKIKNVFLAPVIVCQMPT
jgi:hypothetical protein